MMQKFLHVEHWNVHQSEMDMHILIFLNVKIHNNYLYTYTR